MTGANLPAYVYITLNLLFDPHFHLLFDPHFHILFDPHFDSAMKNSTKVSSEL